MKFHFLVRFYTRPGQSLKICGDLPQLGNNDFDKAVRMNFLNDQFWQLQVEIPEVELENKNSVTYRYIFQEDGQEPLIELKADRSIPLKGHSYPEIQLVDTWNNAGEFENVFFTSPFKKVLLPARKDPGAEKGFKNTTHLFRVKAPLLHSDETVCILGNTTSLHNWDVLKPIAMEKRGDWWEAKMNLTGTDFPITYKYLIVSKKSGSVRRFESGENRILFRPAVKKRIVIVHDGFVYLPNSTWKGAGVAIPVFSLRTRKSFGCGEFSDLKLLADWASAIGLSLIQLLPVNDTISSHTWVDSYPYAAISAFALHPLYLNLEQVAGKKNLALLKPYRKKKESLNSLPEVDYESVVKIKLNLLEEFYPLLKEEIFASEDYTIFFNDNKYWLIPYAVFSFLRDKYGTADTSKWKGHALYDKKAIAKFSAPSQKHYDKIAIHYFTQYHLHKQLKEAHEYANQKGIILKGDIPIGINRYGSDAWTEPGWYDMNVQAGAPPDDFAVKGQNWGFPTYNWTAMQADGYQWWKWRFEQMSNYFDAFRIDHILGFFRIWSIPFNAVEGILGRFVPAIPVHRNEFQERGIWFDYKRYCVPYINDYVLWELFGPNGKKFRPFLMKVRLRPIR